MFLTLKWPVIGACLCACACTVTSRFNDIDVVLSVMAVVTTAHSIITSTEEGRCGLVSGSVCLSTGLPVLKK